MEPQCTPPQASHPDAGDSDAAVVSPPPLDALWPADFSVAPASEAALGRFDRFHSFSDADALERSERPPRLSPAVPAPDGAASKLPPSVPTAKHEQAPFDAKQARQLALAARRRRVYRVKKKSELEALREASAALGARLAELIARKEALKQRLAEDSGAGRFAHGWQGIALRQLRRRIEAEALNRELRGLVREHHGVAQGLAKTLRSQLCLVEHGPLSICEQKLERQPLKEAVQVVDSDARTVAAFLEDIDATYAQAEAVLGQCQLPKEAEQAYNSTLRRRRDPGADCDFFEFIETWKIPFRLEDVVPAMHQALPIVTGKECRPALILVPDPSNTIAIKYLFSATDSQRRVVWFQSIFVAKYFLEKDRAVYRWRAATSERATCGEEIVESGWGVTRRAPHASVGGDNDLLGTKTVFYTRISMRGGQDSERLEMYAHALVNGSQNDVVEWAHVIENLVMNNLVALNIGQAA